MSGYYILDEHQQPQEVVDVREWSQWFETHPRTVALERFTSCRVSTVFLGIDHSFGDGPPVLWETLVFGGALSGKGDRYTSLEDALAGHAAWVERVKAMLTGGDS